MRITRKELDPSLVEKIEQFDAVSSAYNPNMSDGYVALGRNGYYLKRINDAKLRQIYSEDEVIDLVEYIKKPRKNVKSTLLEDFRADNKLNSAARGFLYKKNFEEEYDFDGKIILTKVFADKFVVFTDKGICYILKDNFNKPLFKEDVITLLKKEFTLSCSLHANDVVDIACLENGEILIATAFSGIYKVKLDKSVELFANPDAVRKIEVAANNLLFVATDTFCAFYNLESGKTLEKYYNLANAKQVPIKAFADWSHNIYVVGAPIGVQSSEKILHLWVLDGAGIGYNLADTMIASNSRDNRYQVLLTKVDDNNVYLVGLINSKVFVWSYDKATLRINEEILDCLGELDTLDGFFRADSGYGILTGNKFYLINNNEIIENIELPAKCKEIKLFGGKLYSYFENKLVVFSLTKFEDKADTLSYIVTNSNVICNNIDILVKGVTEENMLKVYDGRTSEEIVPTYYLMYGDCAILKIANAKSGQIVLTVKVDEYTKLEGIVVKENTLFLR